jgi:hypothetical protein
LENRLQTLRDVEIHHFLRDALTGNSAAIESTVTGVNHDNGGRSLGRWLPAFRHDSRWRRCASLDLSLRWYLSLGLRLCLRLRLCLCL